ncbi:thioesterase II family protein [Chromobacterium vaccinii]
MNPSRVSPWFRCYQPRPQAKRRLICLPHAGGSASFYRSWCHLLPTDVELIAVQYPGHEDRLAEPMMDEMGPLADKLAWQIRPLLDRPYLLFGHSMGAAVAHEICLRLREQGLRLPERLVVSAREAPCRHRGGGWHLADDEALLEELSRLDEAAAALRTSVEMRALFLPAIRNDYRLIETYRPRAGLPPLPLPISAFIGHADAELSQDEAAAWSGHGDGGFELRGFFGGHFYLRHNSAVVTALLQLMGEPEPA